VEPTPNLDKPDLQPPPRWIMVVVVGSFIFLLGGAAAGLLLFQNVLRPGQQQRVISVLPFMEEFLPFRPDDNARVPTAQPDANRAISPEDLLNFTFSTATSPPTRIPSQVATTATPTIAVTLTATLTPSGMPAATETPVIPTATIANAFSLPASARIYGLRGVFQTWNNCGPATITMGLSYFGWAEDQVYAASFLKPDEEDKNVTPTEMVQFVNEQSGIRALTRMGGTLDLIRAFITNGFPVIVSIGYAPEGEDWLGHYRAIVGYDDNQQQFYAYDSYLGTGENGAGIIVPYRELDTAWQQFNRRFIVLYEPQNEGRIADILGERGDLMRAAEMALETAQSEARTDSQNGFAWFNIGTALLALERFDEAATAYDRARQLDLPWRMMWYQFGPYEAYFNVGRYSDVIALVNANLNNGGAYVEETYFWQGRVFAVQGRLQEARTSFNRALQANPLYAEAQQALAALESSP
jgi:hypothetical protein